MPLALNKFIDVIDDMYSSPFTVTLQRRGSPLIHIFYYIVKENIMNSTNGFHKIKKNAPLEGINHHV